MELPESEKVKWRKFFWDRLAEYGIPRDIHNLKQYWPHDMYLVLRKTDAVHSIATEVREARKRGDDYPKVPAISALDILMKQGWLSTYEAWMCARSKLIESGGPGTGAGGSSGSTIRKFEEWVYESGIIHEPWYKAYRKAEREYWLEKAREQDMFDADLDEQEDDVYDDGRWLEDEDLDEDLDDFDPYDFDIDKVFPD